MELYSRFLIVVEERLLDLKRLKEGVTGSKLANINDLIDINEGYLKILRYLMGQG